MTKIGSIRVLSHHLKGQSTRGVLMRGASGSFLIKISGAALAFILQVALARYLGTVQYGIYTYVMSLMFLLSILSSLGFERILLRFVASLRVNQEWPTLLGLIKVGTRVVFTFSTIIMAGGILLSLILRDRIGTDMSNTMIAGLVFLPIFSVLRSHSGTLRGFKKVLHAEAAMNTMQPLATLALCGLVYLAYGSLSAANAMWLTVLAVLAVLAWAGMLLRSTIRVTVPKESVAKKLSPWFWTKSAIPFVLIAGAHQVQRYTDILMLGSLKGVELSGLYGAVFRVSDIFLLGYLSVNVIAAPLISEYYSANRTAELKRMVSLISKVSAFITTTGIVAMLLVGKWVLGWFGSEFVAGYEAMVILMIGYLVMSFAGPVELLHVMTGGQWIACRAIGTSALLNIILNAILIPHYGMNGAAFANSFSLSLWTIWLAVSSIKRHQINPTAFSHL